MVQFLQLPDGSIDVFHQMDEAVEVSITMADGRSARMVVANSVRTRILGPTPGGK